MQYPRKWSVPEAIVRAPYLVRDRRAHQIASRASSAIRLPSQAHSASPRPGLNLIPPPTGNVGDSCRRNLRFTCWCIFCGYCQEVCPEESNFPAEGYHSPGRAARR